MTCTKCKYEFLFNPKGNPHRMTDNLMTELIRRASYENTRYFTLSQLYHLYLRHYQKKVGGQNIGCLVVLGMLMIPLSVMGFALEAGIGGGIALLLLFFTPLGRKLKGEPMSLETFDMSYVRTWERDREPIEKLIREPRLNQAPDAGPFQDVFDYGVTFILLVQHELTVDILVHNGWHVEHKALVLAESGYPQYMTERARTCLQNQPDLSVLLLHEGDEDGEAMKDRVLDRQRLPLQATQVRDVGFTAEDTAKMPQWQAWRRHCGDHVPLDAMMYGTVALCLTAAATNNLLISEVLAQQELMHSHFTGMDFG